MKHNDNIMHKCRYHILFCTQYKRKVITEPIMQRLYEIFESICLDNDITLLRCKITQDQVLLHLDMDPRLSVHKAIKSLKRTSSHILREEYHELRTKIPSLWTNAYLVSTQELSESEIADFLSMQKTSQRQ